MCPGCAAVPAAPHDADRHVGHELSHALRVDARTGVRSSNGAADMASDAMFELIKLVRERGGRLELDLDGSIGGYGTCVAVAETSSMAERRDVPNEHQGDACVYRELRCTVATAAHYRRRRVT